MSSTENAADAANTGATTQAASDTTQGAQATETANGADPAAGTQEPSQGAQEPAATAQASPAAPAAQDTAEAAATAEAATKAAAIATQATGVAATEMPLGLSTNQIVTLVTTLGAGIAGAVAPGLTVAGFTISQLANLAVGVANEIPQAVAAFEEIKQVATSGLPPTADQWAAWNAAADAAHNSLQAAAAAVE